MHMKKTLPALAAAALAMSLCASSQAGDTIELADNVKLDWRLTGTYTNSLRMAKPDSLLTSRVSNAGGNDGNNNFAHHATTANRLALNFETKVYRGDGGVVLSASSFYDAAYRTTNDNNPAANNPGGLNKPAPFNQFTDEARRYHGGYSRILDAYAFTSLDTNAVGRLTLRGGRHVVSWGEALFLPGISLAQGPADGTKTGVPGTEIKDLLLPEDQLSAILEINPRWSLMAHAQFNWHGTLAAAPGSFMSNTESVGPGANCLGPYAAIPPVPPLFAGFNGCSFGVRGADIKPGKTGQWGLGTRFRVSDDTELGFYYLNYHDRTPLPEINAFTPGTPIPAPLQASFGGIKQIGNGSYQIRYFDNIPLIGASFNTTMGAVAFAGELSHKLGAPALVNTVVNPATNATLPSPTRADVTQLNLNAFYNAGRSPLAASSLLLGEVSYVKVGNVEARKAPGAEAFPANFGFGASDQLSFKTNRGLAISGTLALSYPGVFEGWDLAVPISASRQLKGRTILGGVGGEGDTRYSLGATLTKGGNFSVGLTYLGFLGSASVDLLTYRPFTDRNQLSLVMKYAL